MRAKNLMTTSPITCHVNDTLTVAAHRMWEADVGALPVVNDDGKLTAMITDRDICMAAYTQGRGLGDILVNSAMAAPVVAGTPESTIAEIEELMARHQIRRIPIVDGSGFPIGIVSTNDLAIECVQPDTKMNQGAANVAHTVAAICQHRAVNRETA